MKQAIIITIGDEPCHGNVSKEVLQDLFGSGEKDGLASELLKEARKKQEQSIPAFALQIDVDLARDDQAQKQQGRDSPARSQHLHRRHVLQQDGQGQERDAPSDGHHGDQKNRQQ